MSKRLTMQEKIDRFVASITTRKVEKAFLERGGQCIGCMTATTGEMLDDAFQNYEHLILHMQEKYLTWGMMKHAYMEKEPDEELAEISLMSDGYGDIGTVQEYVKDFLMKRLVGEVAHETDN